MLRASTIRTRDRHDAVRAQATVTNGSAGQLVAGFIAGFIARSYGDRDRGEVEALLRVVGNVLADGQRRRRRGRGRVRTCTTPPEPSKTKSSTSEPSGAIACARTPAGPGACRRDRAPGCSAATA